VQPADEGDTKTIEETLTTAAENIEKAHPDSKGIQELVADKGYHSNETLVDLTDLDIRTYVSEPNRGRRNWTRKDAAREAVYGIRRRIRGARGQKLLRRRGEHLERSFAHAYETGRLRRVHLRGRSNILKRVLAHIGALNLGLLMRVLVGVGTPRSLQGRLRELAARFSHFVGCYLEANRCFWSQMRNRFWANPSIVPVHFCLIRLPRTLAFTTGCYYA